MNVSDNDNLKYTRSQLINHVGFRFIFFLLALYYILSAASSWHTGRSIFSLEAFLLHWPAVLTQFAFMFAVVMFHRLGHAIASRSYGHQLSFLPWLIPGGWPYGFSVMIDSLPSSIRSQRKRVMAALAGPLAGTIASACIFCVGLLFSSTVTVVESNSTFMIQFSLIEHVFHIALFGLLSDGTIIVHNPIALAGNVGFWMVALHCLPMVPFDGAFALETIVGRRLAHNISLITMVGLFTIGVLKGFEGGLSWIFIAVIGFIITIGRSWKPEWFALWFWNESADMQADLSKKGQVAVLTTFAVLFLLTVRFIWA